MAVAYNIVQGFVLPDAVVVISFVPYCTVFAKLFVDLPRCKGFERTHDFR